MTQVAQDIVDILLEADWSPEDMATFIRDALFTMTWTRKPYPGQERSLAGEYTLRFKTPSGYTGNISFSLSETYSRKLEGRVTVYVVMRDDEYGPHDVSSRWRQFSLRKNQFEQFRAAWQKFVREQIPLTVKDGQISKMRLVAQITKVLRQFRITPAQKADQASIEALKAALEQANISHEVLSAAVDAQDALEDGHTSDYSEMTPADVEFWMNFVREHGARMAESLEQELTHAATQEPWIDAQRAWDRSVRAGYGDNPWVSVLRSLGYSAEDEPLDPRGSYTLPGQLQSVMLDVSSEDLTPEEGWQDVHDLMLVKGVSPEHIDAIRRLWFRQLG